ncbi:MAG: hypothetical protein AUJ85_00655 [Elusimicrobia bacterium CG1_02_37_114]|nr:MAG: hypothetical protein AUJ85_00655 [Elusimicrobia bacterium CG1_02_37_114]
MDRIYKIGKEELAQFSKINLHQRLKQASCALRLYYSVHPILFPQYKFYKSLKQFFKHGKQ